MGILFNPLTPRTFCQNCGLFFSCPRNNSRDNKQIINKLFREEVLKSKKNPTGLLNQMVISTVLLAVNISSLKLRDLVLTDSYAKVELLTNNVGSVFSQLCPMKLAHIVERAEWNLRVSVKGYQPDPVVTLWIDISVQEIRTYCPRILISCDHFRVCSMRFSIWIVHPSVLSLNNLRLQKTVKVKSIDASVNF